MEAQILSFLLENEFRKSLQFGKEKDCKPDTNRIVKTVLFANRTQCLLHTYPLGLLNGNLSKMALFLQLVKQIHCQKGLLGTDPANPKSCYFFYTARSRTQGSMTTLMEHRCAQPREWSFWPKKLMSTNIFLIKLVLDCI